MMINRTTIKKNKTRLFYKVVRDMTFLQLRQKKIETTQYPYILMRNLNLNLFRVSQNKYFLNKLRTIKCIITDYRKMQIQILIMELFHILG
jgi:hypothetical protein